MFADCKRHCPCKAVPSSLTACFDSPAVSGVSPLNLRASQTTCSLRSALCSCGRHPAATIHGLQLASNIHISAVYLHSLQCLFAANASLIWMFMLTQHIRVFAASCYPYHSKFVAGFKHQPRPTLINSFTATSCSRACRFHTSSAQC